MKKKIKEEIIKRVMDGQSVRQIMTDLKVGDRTIKQVKEGLKKLLPGVDVDVLIENVRLAKKAQKYQDLHRIQNKSFREHARWDNALSEYLTQLKSVLTKHILPNKSPKAIKISHSQAVGVLQISDAHFNELVEMESNKFDFEIANQRIRKLITKSVSYFKLNKVNTVVVAFTGDLLNSDRRPDEILAAATNRSKATFLAVAILTQALLELNKNFIVKVTGVVGNESRLDKDVGWTDLSATNNYDFMIFNMLKTILKKQKTIQFIIPANYNEEVIEVEGQNILLVHGYTLNANVEKEVQSIKGKYASRGIAINFIIFGHKHSCRIGDTYARSASVVGANAYSDAALQLEGRASQNIHIIYNDYSRDSIKIDLQNVQGIIGYDISKELAEYNPKSAKKANKELNIVKVKGDED